MYTQIAEDEELYFAYIEIDFDSLVSTLYCHTLENLLNLWVEYVSSMKEKLFNTGKTIIADTTTSNRYANDETKKVWREKLCGAMEIETVERGGAHWLLQKITTKIDNSIDLVKLRT